MILWASLLQLKEMYRYPKWEGSAAQRHFDLALDHNPQGINQATSLQSPPATARRPCDHAAVARRTNRVIQHVLMFLYANQWGKALLEPKVAHKGKTPPSGCKEYRLGDAVGCLMQWAWHTPGIQPQDIPRTAIKSPGQPECF